LSFDQFPKELFAKDVVLRDIQRDPRASASTWTASRIHRSVLGFGLEDGYLPAASSTPPTTSGTRLGPTGGGTSKIRQFGSGDVAKGGSRRRNGEVGNESCPPRCGGRLVDQCQGYTWLLKEAAGSTCRSASRTPSHSTTCWRRELDVQVLFKEEPGRPKAGTQLKCTAFTSPARKGARVRKRRRGALQART